MTKLTAGKPVIRETDVLERGEPIVVALHPRTSLNVDYGAVLDLARKLAWRREHGGVR